jgi:hypothetical protein
MTGIARFIRFELINGLNYNSTSDNLTSTDSIFDRSWFSWSKSCRSKFNSSWISILFCLFLNSCVDGTRKDCVWSIRVFSERLWIDSHFFITFSWSLIRAEARYLCRGM